MKKDDFPISDFTYINDPARLKELADTNLLDNKEEEAFSNLTQRASKLLGALVLFNIIDDKRQSSKSMAGIESDVREVPLNMSYCKYVVESRSSMIVEDATEHEITKKYKTPIELGAMSYCGVPITTKEGHTIGTLCAFSREVRSWGEEEQDILMNFADLIVNQIEIRREKYKLKTYKKKYIPSEEKCDEQVIEGSKLIGKAWTAPILHVLYSGPKRFRDITSQIDGVSNRVLSQRLSSMEDEGLIEKTTVKNESVYALTKWGLSARTVTRNLSKWMKEKP